MAYDPIDINSIKVGDPITKELFDKIKNNLDDHENRLNQFETTGGSVFILDQAFHFANFNGDQTDIFYYKCVQDFEISDFRIQLFNKGSIVTGSLSLDLQKASTTNNASFSSVLTTALVANFAVDASYAEKVASINSSVNSVVVGDVIRIVVNGIPAGFKDKILMFIGGE